jgi:uncharacterized membrane protein YfcA
MSPALFAGIVVAGVAVGIFAALFGVGGGVLMVPFIVFVLDEGQHLAEGTSLLAMTATAIVGAIAHGRRGFVDRRTAAIVGAAGVAGAIVGASLALEISGEVLRRLFGVMIVVMGARLIYEARSGKPGEGSAPVP